ncbi:PLA2G4D, partial [Symbiodinium sp. CCMP2456]
MPMLKLSDSQEAYLTVGVTILDSRHDPTPPPRADMPQLFRVEIQRAVSLRNADWVPGTNISDPYVKCHLRSGDGRTVSGDKASLRTPTIKNSTEPVWDFSGSLSVPKGAELVFEVLDQDLTGSDFLGRSVVNYEKLSSGNFKEDLVLEGSQSNRKARLSVRIATVEIEIERLKRLGAQQEKLGFHEQAQKCYSSVDEIHKDANSYLSADGIENLQALARIAKHLMAFDQSLVHLQEARRVSLLLCRAKSLHFAQLLAEM